MSKYVVKCRRVEVYTTTVEVEAGSEEAAISKVEAGLVPFEYPDDWDGHEETFEVENMV